MNYVCSWHTGEELKVRTCVKVGCNQVHLFFLPLLQFSSFIRFAFYSLPWRNGKGDAKNRKKLTFSHKIELLHHHHSQHHHHQHQKNGLDRSFEAGSEASKMIGNRWIIVENVGKLGFLEFNDTHCSPTTTPFSVIVIWWKKDTVLKQTRMLQHFDCVFPNQNAAQYFTAP